MYRCFYFLLAATWRKSDYCSHVSSSFLTRPC